MKNILALFGIILLTSACGQPNHFSARGEGGGAGAYCADALIAYAERYPEAQPQDLYKLVFQDLYGPGHLLTDSLAAVRYISREIDEMQADSSLLTPHSSFPSYEYTLCDSHFVRVNLSLIQEGTLQLADVVSAVLRSAEGLPAPDHRFVMSHSPQFKAAYKPHYRIIRRDIFEHEILPLL